MLHDLISPILIQANPEMETTQGRRARMVAGRDLSLP